MTKGKQLEETLSKAEERTSIERVSELNEKMTRIFDLIKEGEITVQVELLSKVLNLMETDASIYIPKQLHQTVRELADIIFVGSVATYYTTCITYREKDPAIYAEAKKGFASVMALLEKPVSQNMLAPVASEKGKAFWVKIASYIQHYSNIDFEEAITFRSVLPPVKRVWEETSAKGKIDFRMAELMTLKASELPKAAETLMLLCQNAFKSKELKKEQYHRYLDVLYQHIFLRVYQIAKEIDPKPIQHANKPFAFSREHYQQMGWVLEAKRVAVEVGELRGKLTDVSKQASSLFDPWESHFIRYRKEYDAYVSNVVKTLVEQETKRETALKARYRQLKQSLPADTYAPQEEQEETEAAADPLLPFKKQFLAAMKQVQQGYYKAANYDFALLMQKLAYAETHDAFTEEAYADFVHLKSEASLGYVDSFLYGVRPSIEQLLNLQVALHDSLASPENFIQLERKVKQGYDVLRQFPEILKDLHLSTFYMQQAQETPSRESAAWRKETTLSLGHHIHLLQETATAFVRWEKAHKKLKIQRQEYDNSGYKQGDTIKPPAIETQLRWSMLNPWQIGLMENVASTIAQFKEQYGFVAEEAETVVNEGKAEEKAIQTQATYKDILLKDIKPDAALPALSSVSREAKLLEWEGKALKDMLKEAKKTTDKKKAYDNAQQVLHTLSHYEEAQVKGNAQLHAIQKEAVSFKQEASYHYVLMLKEEMESKSQLKRFQPFYENFSKVKLANYLSPIEQLHADYVAPLAAAMEDAFIFARSGGEKKRCICEEKLAATVKSVREVVGIAVAFQEKVQDVKAVPVNREALDRVVGRLKDTVEMMEGLRPEAMEKKERGRGTVSHY